MQKMTFHILNRDSQGSNGVYKMLQEELEDDELSAELYSFHEAAFRLQEMEEEMVDGHKALLDGLPIWQMKLTNLVETTDRIDFNLEGT